MLQQDKKDMVKIKDGKNVEQLVLEECAKLGLKLHPDNVEFVIWEKTGWPCFWPNSKLGPEDNLRLQVAEWAHRVMQRKWLNPIHLPQSHMLRLGED